MITEGTLKSGEKVFINDYVYAAAPWDKRDPVPYSIGRIIEFISADINPVTWPPPVTVEEALQRKQGLKVRVAWFYRPTDVQDKGIGDHRLLLAALFSEIIPFTNVRAKCIVRHRDKIADLNAYKKKEDRFYFHQLFDPFTKEHYEVIFATDVHNLPGHIKDVLVSRYEFVVCERDFLPDLQDNLRLCETCGDWCPGPESVMCELCKNHYHMECVNPPLNAKPSRGYGWSCASCNSSRRDNNEIVATTSKHRQNKDPFAKARNAKVRAAKVDEEEDKYWKGWSFRYFGQHTVAEDTLDPDDMIYVRAPTRIGRAFQTMVSDKPIGESDDPDIPIRGEDLTVEPLSRVVHMPPSVVEDLERRKSMLTPRQDLQVSVDFIEEVIRRFSEAWENGLSFYSVNMRKPLCVRAFKDGKEQRYRDRDWSEQEEAIFDESVRKHHSELRHVRSDLKTRTMPEIVRYFGHWKSEQQRRARFERISQEQMDALVQKQSDDNESIYGKFDRRSYSCAVCRTRESEIWWRAPRNLPTNAMCDDCGMQWRKYAIKSARGTEKEKEYLARASHSHYGTPDPPSTRSGTALSKALAADKLKRELTPLAPPLTKKPRVSAGAQTPLKLVCCLCRKGGPNGQIVKCKKCGFSIHAGCVGAPLEEATPDWTCEICSNEQTLESNLDTKCALCPPHPAERKKGSKDSAFFRAAKPTEFRGWVHILCATFNNQLEYTDSKRMRLVEGIVSIPMRNYTQKCGCCGGSGGCVSQCDQCLTMFHPVCAWNHGYKMGIEFVPVKPNQKKEYPTVEFRGELGIMNAVILCDNHSGHPKKIYDLCDLDEKGRMSTSNALNSEKNYGLLRKARRLDEIISAPRFDAVPVLKPELELPLYNVCVYCSTEFSPYWWPIGPSDTDTAAMEVDHPAPNGAISNGRHTNPEPHDDATKEVDHMETDEDAVKQQPTPPPPTKGVCHSCYYKRQEEKGLPIELNLNSDILVV